MNLQPFNPSRHSVPAITPTERGLVWLAAIAIPIALGVGLALAMGAQI